VPGYAAAVAAGSMHRGVVGYKEHTALLKKDDLPRISKKQFYNLQRKGCIAAAEERGAKEKEREEEQEMLAANWLAFSAPADVETDEVKQPQVAPDVASRRLSWTRSHSVDLGG